MLFLRPIHNSIHSGFSWYFASSFSWSAGTLQCYIKYFSIKSKCKKNCPYIYLSLLYLGHLHVVILCITFLGKSFANLNPEILKLKFLDRVLSILYVLILEQLLVQKILYFFCSCGLWQTSTFQVIYKHPLSR